MVGNDLNLEDAVLREEFDHEFQSSESETETEEQLDNEEKTKNPVKKYQFVYDESLCMVDKYPEIKVAPGEGQRPKSVLTDKNWDVKAFPQLHNPDGSNGKDAVRKVKITDQRYFIQRILNKETRFARSPAYLYAAVAYLEEQQIWRNIGLVGVRGKKITAADGKEHDKCSQ